METPPLTVDQDLQTLIALRDKLAELRADLEPVLPDLKARKNEAAKRVKDAEDALTAAEDELRKAALDYVTSTGDLNLPEGLTFRRSTKLMYEPAEILSEIVQTELMEMGTGEEWDGLIPVDDAYAMLGSGKLGKYVKVVVSLDVKAFEADWKDGLLKWADIEQVPAPQVAISKLGSIIIQKEMAQVATQE